MSNLFSFHRHVCCADAGAIVTQTDSGRGCGDDWPLCNGKFIPAYTLESLIEYSHRMVTVIVGLLVLTTFIYTWRHHSRSREARTYAGGTLLGHSGVYGSSSCEMVAAACCAGATFWYFVACSGQQYAVGPMDISHKKNRRILAMESYPQPIFLLAWGIWLFCYGVVYLGAFIRHMEADRGCVGWPLCNGQIIPYMSGASGIVFFHRVTALLLFFLITALYILVRRRESCKREDTVAPGILLLLFIVFGQMLSGAWLTLTIHSENMYLFSILFHNGLATLLFGVLTDIGIRLWKHRYISS